jgi:AbrB family looped-hinge helix DNA binding protein
MIMCLSTKGQVTIPLEVRTKAGLTSGSAVDINFIDGVICLRPVAQAPSGRGAAALKRLRGSASIRMSTDEILRLTRSED